MVVAGERVPARAAVEVRRRTGILASAPGPVANTHVVAVCISNSKIAIAPCLHANLTGPIAGAHKLFESMMNTYNGSASAQARIAKHIEGHNAARMQVF